MSLLSVYHRSVCVCVCVRVCEHRAVSLLIVYHRKKRLRVCVCAYVRVCVFFIRFDRDNSRTRKDVSRSGQTFPQTFPRSHGALLRTSARPLLLCCHRRTVGRKSKANMS